MSNRTGSAAFVASLVLSALAALAFVPTAAAHDCTYSESPSECGDCPEGHTGTHAHTGGRVHCSSTSPPPPPTDPDCIVHVEEPVYVCVAEAAKLIADLSTNSVLA